MFKFSVIKKILIIDDEERLRSLISRILELEGYKVYQAGDAKSGLKLLETEDIPVVLSDVKLPDGNGVELVNKIKQINPFIEVINLTAFGNIPDGVQAIKNGAFDYITKGDDNDKIIPLVAKAMDKAILQRKVHELERKLEKRFGFDAIIGKSAVLQNAKNLAQKVSGTDTTVLLLGETGTGKEIFAQAIHYTSKRKDQNFVAVNCSAFGKDIMESELFGHKAGAFTGALKDKKGLFEEADHGTIFLDEIGEMSLDLQAKLLRVLEDGSFIKVGDTKTTQTNVRIIAATNRNLEQEISRGAFREDLFYRLSVFAIHLPSLNERKEDIPGLVSFYIGQFAQKLNKPVPKADDQFFIKLQNHLWNYATNAVKFQADQKQVHIESHCAPHLPKVYVDVEKTTWVLINFLSNALRYSPEKGKVRIEVKHIGDQIEFSVLDFGKGIEEQYQARLFERYFQVPTDGKNKSGTGLGLAISKDFIEAQKGEIFVESELGAGSRFGFRLPVSS